LLFGVTESDIAVLTEDEFADVWNALGKVARARSRASVAPPVSTDEVSEVSPDEDGGMK
jgi:hypothetical protein